MRGVTRITGELTLLLALVGAACSDPGRTPSPLDEAPDADEASEARGPGPRGQPVDDQPPAPEIALDDQRGQPFRLSEQRGRAVLLFFGFVHCPDVCPATLSTWGRLQRALGEEADAVRCVFVTVDPERDTAERVADHLAIYGGGIIGLTGTEEELAEVWEAYDIHREVMRFGDTPGSYIVDHTAEMILVDGDGRQRLRHGFDVSVEDLLHDVRLVLQGEP
jgi:protein SCO1/2